MPISGTLGIDLSVKINLVCYLSGESKAKPSISGFVPNLNPHMGVFGVAASDLNRLKLNCRSTHNLQAQ